MKFYYYFVIIFLVYPISVMADNEILKPYKKQFITLLSENDNYSFMKTDRYYTNGLRIGYVSKEYDLFNEKNAMSWARYVSIASYNKPHITRFHINLNQEMYTPSKHSSIPPKNDHLYGGFLYFNIGVYNRTQSSLEHIGVKLGFVGPWSFAKEAQTALHELGDMLTFKGWDTQLANEFIFNPYYSYTYRGTVFQTKYISMDFLGTLEFAVGNADVHFGGYTQLRLGHNLHVDFGIPRINSMYDGSPANSNDFSMYVFVGGGSRVVLWNIFIQGNSASTRKGYDLNLLRSEVTCGLVISHNGYRIGYSYTYNTRDYTQQPHTHAIGSITLEFAF